MYTPLYIKTDNSLQESLIKIKDLIEFAKKNNIKSLTITDNNMYGVMDFYKMCITNSIKPIIGLEIEYKSQKLVLYAINYDGYKNLIKLCTIKSERSLNLEDIKEHSDDLVCITPFESLSVYDEIKSFFKYIYVSYKDTKQYSELSYENLVYMNEILYLNPNDSMYLKYLRCIKNSSVLDNENGDDIHNHLMGEAEANLLYPRDLKNNYFISQICNVQLPFHLKLMPKYENDDGIDSYSYLKKKCIEGLKARFGTTVKEIYKTRLKYELDIINKMGFCDYFLIVSDYVRYARENKIIATCRGSAVGSLVSYCLMITDVDPVKYNLIFERFLNPERISMPDIDIDFEHEKRQDIINYCIGKYGKKRVAPIITFGTLGAKQALRDVSKALNIDAKLIDTLCNLIDSKLTLIENYKANPKIKNLIDRFDTLEKCFKVALKFEGLKRHTSIHAAGVVMSNIDLDEIIPLDSTHSFYISGYDMTYLEEIGLLKMDFLAIKYLTTIHNIIESINASGNKDLSFDNIPLNDTKALSIFNKADTIGIFQFESDGMINFLKKLKVTSMDDLFAAIALFRPGPMKNIPSYIARKNGKEKINYLSQSLEPILKSTYGIMIYQEQIMQVAHVMANYSLGEADILRKAMSKKNKEILLSEKEKFTLRASQNGYSIETIDSVYNSMLKFAEYGFNKSHSISYSLVSYKMAYLKAYYPKQFITYLLSMEVNDIAKTKQYIYCAKKNNINILPPSINLSFRKYSIEDGGIRYPLSSIKNIGISISEFIITERNNGKYIDIYDFLKRCYGKVVTKKSLESLIYSGALSEFGYNKKTLVNNLDLIINYGELIKDLDRTYALAPEIILYPEYSLSELMEKELDIFGFYLTDNPITELKAVNKSIIDLNELELYFDKIINVIVYIDKIKEINTSKGDKMCFILGSDELSMIDIILFPNVYKKYSDLKVGDIIKVKGKVEKRYDKYQLVSNEVERLSL